MRVLIVGAGVAGLSCAVAMRRAHGSDVTLIERASAVGASRGTGVAIPPNGARALKKLGLDVDRLIGKGSRLREYHVLTPSGRLITKADLTRLWLSPAEPYFAVHRHHLYDQLLEMLAGQQIDFETTADLLLAAGARGGPVRAHISGPGGARDQEFDLVVGADGIRSSVRRALWPEVTPRGLGWSTWRCVLEYPGALAATQVVYSGRGGVILHIPLSGGMAYVYAAIRHGSGTNGGHSQAAQGGRASGHGREIGRLFGDYNVSRDLLDRLAAMPDSAFHVGVLEEIPHEELTSSGQGGVLVLGDALHACSPSMAQGVSLAVEDACVLAEVAGTEDQSGSVAERFWQRRLPRIRHVQKCTRKRDHLINRRAESVLFAGVSNLVMRIRGGDSIQREAFGYLLDTPL